MGKLLCIIFKNLWQYNDVPTSWKKGNITPFFKTGGKREDLWMYRPVSLTSVPKIIEQIVLETMLSHVKNKEGICDSQHGFNTGKSCLTNLVAFCNGVTVVVNEGKAIEAICLGLCKTRDVVPHYAIVSKMEGD